MSLSLGPFQIEHPFILAPMAGITHSPFRRLMRRFQSALVISELISANGMVYRSERTLELLKFHSDERILGFQIFGEEPDRLCLAAQKVQEVGADFVDLNLGCPVSKVVQKGAGAALCRDVVSLGRLLEKLVRSVSIPVSIKIRLGWDAQSHNAVEVARIAADVGIAWVAIHGRTRAQGYAGVADWEAIGNVQAKVKIPILGNGDLQTPESALEKWQHFKLAAVLIGRGALRNPFIFQQASALFRGESYSLPTVVDYLNLFQQQQGFLTAGFSESLALFQARKFLAWYSMGFPHCHDFRSQLFLIPEANQLWELAREFFEKSTLERQEGDPSFLSGGHG